MDEGERRDGLRARPGSYALASSWFCPGPVLRRGPVALATGSMTNLLVRRMGDVTAVWEWQSKPTGMQEKQRVL